jgi:hypothetical protein
LRFEKIHEPYSGSTDPLDASNGSLMRLAPVPCSSRKTLGTRSSFQETARGRLMVPGYVWTRAAILAR